MTKDRLEDLRDSSAGELPSDARRWALDRVDEILDSVADESGLLQLDDLPRPGPERRTEPRYSLEEPARVEVGSWSELLELYTKDISNNGIFIQTTELPELGTRVGVHLLLPNGTGTIRFQGQVAHVLPPEAAPVPGFGVRFEGVTREAKNTLQWILAQAKAAIAAPRPVRPGTRRPASGRPKPSADESHRERQRRLRTVLCDLAARSDLAVLELPPSPSVEQIDDAFETLAEEWRPKPGGRVLSPEVTELTRAIFSRIERAYRRVREDAAR